MSSTPRNSSPSPSRNPKPDKREAILDAMLSLIVDRGLHAAPMSALAQNASASPGVIYHYFPSKEDLLHAVYVRVTETQRSAILDGYVAGQPAAASFQTLFLNTYRFYRTHQRESKFLAQYENSPVSLTPNVAEAETPSAAPSPFAGILNPRKTRELRRDLPAEVLHEMTFGLALRLATHETLYKPATLKKIAQSVWLSIAVHD